MDRREFMKGAALGVGAGVLGSMGLYSYSPLRRAFLPEVKRGTADIGVCKSVKVTNISETSWFDNGIFMNDVTGAGGLLVDQYTFNWAPFGNGKGVGKGTFEEGLKRPIRIAGSDISPEAIELARHNAQLAEVDDIVRFEAADARTFHWGGMYGRIVTNPPYGERIMERREAEELYRAFGKAYRGLPPGWSLALLSSHTEFERTFGRTADKKRKLYNGMIKCDLFLYHKRERG